MVGLWFEGWLMWGDGFVLYWCCCLVDLVVGLGLRIGLFGGLGVGLLFVDWLI